MIYSAGIIPYRSNDNGEMEFFVGHAGGNHVNGRSLWMFLKGHVEGDENWEETAIREFQEETNIEIPKEKLKHLIPLGQVLQNSYKTTIAFGIHYPEIDPHECHSNMAEEGGYPEIDGYQWMPYSKLKLVTHPTHIGFYEQLLAINGIRDESY